MLQIFGKSYRCGDQDPLAGRARRAVGGRTVRGFRRLLPGNRGELKKKSESAAAEAEAIILDKLSGGGFSLQDEVFTGHVKQIIVDEAKGFKAGQIVMRPHETGFFDRVTIGSVSDFVVRHAPCSVLVGRNDEDNEE